MTYAGTVVTSFNIITQNMQINGRISSKQLLTRSEYLAGGGFWKSGDLMWTNLKVHGTPLSIFRSSFNGNIYNHNYSECVK